MKNRYRVFSVRDEKENRLVWVVEDRLGRPSQYFPTRRMARDAAREGNENDLPTIEQLY